MSKNSGDTCIEQPEQKNVLLTISYDGTDFAGWQKQLKHGVQKARTVQGEIETALERMHKHPVDLFGSGRTDSGVHAIGQIANFRSDIKNIQSGNYVQALNSCLPQDIRIMDARFVDDSFNARFNSKSRTYKYFCNCAPVTPAHILRYCWNLRYTPNISTLNSMAALLSGEMDFTSFAASGDVSQSKHRYIEDARFIMQESRLVFSITANAFLYHMVRSLVGTMLELEKKGCGEKEFLRILEACDRKAALFTAPAKGLFLWQVRI